jgi:hypothetical protein
MKSENFPAGIYRLNFPKVFLSNPVGIVVSPSGAEDDLCSVRPEGRSYVNRLESGSQASYKGWITNEKGDYLEIIDGKELEIQGVCSCKKKDTCDAGYWCPGRFKVTKPFRGLFCLVLYDKDNPNGILKLSLLRSLKWKNGKLLRRMNLRIQNQDWQIQNYL